ncbi:hypothetical protein, partial [Methylosinus sporium]|uniref:hypothetical protein n=1 Tax=Methylosinus sporium TaxID=428 RepID=UPI00163D8A9D
MISHYLIELEITVLPAEYQRRVREALLDPSDRFPQSAPVPNKSGRQKDRVASAARLGSYAFPNMLGRQRIEFDAGAGKNRFQCECGEMLGFFGFWASFRGRGVTARGARASPIPTRAEQRDDAAVLCSEPKGGEVECALPRGGGVGIEQRFERRTPKQPVVGIFRTHSGNEQRPHTSHSAWAVVRTDIRQMASRFDGNLPRLTGSCKPAVSTRRVDGAVAEDK